MAVTETGKVGGQVRKIVVKGTLPADKYGEIFRLFVGPASRMRPKRFNIGLQLEIEPADRPAVGPRAPVIKQMREAARQLGLEFEVEADEVEGHGRVPWSVELVLGSTPDHAFHEQHAEQIRGLDASVMPRVRAVTPTRLDVQLRVFAVSGDAAKTEAERLIARLIPHFMWKIASASADRDIPRS